MNPTQILYIDENGVSVTRYTLKTKRNSYPLREIRKPVLSVVQPKRVFAILAVMWGMVLLTSNYVNATTPELIPAFDFTGNVFSTFYSGVALIVIGLLALLLMRERYVLQILTTKGQKNVLVSSRRDYIYTIMHTLRTAMLENKYANRPVIQRVNSGLMDMSSYISLN